MNAIKLDALRLGSAGMLAPHAKVHFEERELLRLGVQSCRMYPEWVAELETDSQMSAGYRAEGTLIVGVDRDDARELEHLYESQKLLDLKVEWITGAEAREIEPAALSQNHCSDLEQG